jgi:hypothetical protein
MTEANELSAQIERGKQKTALSAEREKCKDMAYEREKNSPRT